MSSFVAQSSQQAESNGLAPLEIRPTPLATPVHPEAVALHRYWLDCGKRGGLRLGRDLPAREIAKLMARLSVLEPNADESDFRFRLVGSSWLGRFARDIQGAWLSSLYDGDIYDRYRAGLRAVLATGDAKFTDVHVYQDRRLMHHIEYVQVPVDGSAEPARCVLMGAFRHD